MSGVGFEPTRHSQSILSAPPFFVFSVFVCFCGFSSFVSLLTLRCCSCLKSTFPWLLFELQQVAKSHQSPQSQRSD